MWIFGQVNQEEYEKLKSQGWEIIRKPSYNEVDKFCDPKVKIHLKYPPSEIPQDGEFFVLICFDYDLASVADDILAQGLKREAEAAQFMELRKNVKLSGDTKNAAQEAYEDYDFFSGDDAFPEGSTLEDSNGWDVSRNRYERVVFYLCEGEDCTRKATFVILFKEGSAEIEDKYVNLH